MTVILNMFFFHVWLLYKQYSLKNIKIIVLKSHGLFKLLVLFFVLKFLGSKSQKKIDKKTLNVCVVYYSECNLMKTIMLLCEQCNFSKS